jgi:hypothetical protein
MQIWMFHSGEGVKKSQKFYAKKNPTDHQIRQQTSSLSYNPTNPNPTLSPISTILKLP